MKYKYSYNENSGVSVCEIIYKNRVFTGRAYIHPEDRDMQSERTGAVIAQARAAILLNQHILSNELRPALANLKHIYGTLESSSKFNKDSYEAKRLRSEIQHLENLVATTKEQLIGEKQNLKEYIDLKDKMYKNIRKKRLEDKID